jgi:predicted phosphodiesterase
VIGRIAFLSDIHFPEHHKKAWDLTLKILPDLNIDLLYGGGDWFDLEQLSRFDVHPDRRMVLKYDIDATRKELARLRDALPYVEIQQKFGNHELRYEKKLFRSVPELIGVKGHSVSEAFGTADFDIEWIPTHRRVQFGKLLFVHGDEVLKSGGVNAARNLYMKVTGNVICGHFHAEGKYIHTLGGNMQQEGAWVNSCLRTLRPEWAPYSQWTLGFSVIDFSPSGFFHVEQILFLKRGGSLWCTVDGKEYSV